MLSELAYSVQSPATAVLCSIQVTGLQNQVTMLLASQRAAAEGSSKLAALEGVIGRLQATLSHISAMAGKAAHENKLLLCENQQLAAERGFLQDALQQLKARARELEADLLVKVAASSQEAAEAAADTADPLLLLGRGDLGAAAASSCSFAAGIAAGGKRIGPALQEIAALKRSKEVLQREVARLQQQLSAAERDAQAAAAAAAAERARAARNAGQRQNRLAAALHRLEGVTAREQQQATTLQEAVHDAAPSSARGCYSPPPVQGLLGSAAASPARLQPGQVAGLLPAQLSIQNAGGDDEEEAGEAACEARLVARVLEMERSMQALESQLMHVGCSATAVR
ncbi:hypothetical protein COO60DRAFT_1624642 [Scenedesmus sp. NREL 46B-D3]|nr:hypothetical protein COO60DRAFT_1624642 [Scenedesmus sp. NREL 46B-D3]